ncbi:hypothetical protein SCARD494_12434 [Seiridium cardinale]
MGNIRTAWMTDSGRNHTSSRPRDVGSSFASRRGHANQLSISDSSHHITETIGTLYGDDDDYQANDSRPMSFIASPYGGEQISRHRQEMASPEEHRLRIVRSHSDNIVEQPPSSPTMNGSAVKKANTLPNRMPSERSTGGPNSPRSPMSPTLREMTGEDTSQFPMGNIENASDITQELRNLQALRRMSMDVSNTHDPDLLPYQGMSLMAMPSIAPQGDDDEADPSRLLWVPAGVHPELAPTEFKNFLEKRVQSIKRRSSESVSSSLSVDGLERSNSGLRRKKSMLSRQIDNAGGRGADGYMDGAERLERKYSANEPDNVTPEGLSLDELVKDPSKAVQRLTLESQQSGGDSPDDMPILPVAPGMGLRRSTRTTYRKGGSFKDRHGGSVRGERLPFSKRIAARKAEEADGDGSNIADSPMDAPKGYGLSRVQSEPVGAAADNYARPPRAVRRQQTFTRETGDSQQDASQQEHQDSAPEPLGNLRHASSYEDTHASRSSVPQVIETSTTDDTLESAASQYQSRPFPERSSSQQAQAQSSSQYNQIPEEPPARSSRRPNYGQPSQPQQPQQAQQAPQAPQSTRPQRTETLNEMTQQPSPLPGGNSTRTDSLTFIPTFAAPEERKTEKKGKKDSESKATSWKWFKSDDKDKKKKEEKKDREDEGKKSKAKALVEKAHDNVRLDVLQTSIDNVKQKGRESLLLDRESVDDKLEEERRKESNRKSEPKKEKDGLFANLFGGKKKGDRDSGGRKSHSQRPLSPEPAPYRPLVPDTDYHWTRFPILEERAIYRMAHIKLANPRRALYSQVLLSNFMYAYLAKVQAMHPQIQVPQSPQQKRLQEEERRRREHEQQQQYLEQQQAAQESMDQYNFEYHRSSNQYGDSQTQQTGDYPEDAEVYDYEHGRDQYDNNGGYQHDNRRHDDQNDMW